MDIREILRQLRAGESDRQIHRNLKVNRQTIKKYREWAKQEGLLKGELLPIEELEIRLQKSFAATPPPAHQSTVEPYREVIEQLYAEGVKGKVIWLRLKERGYTGSVGAVYRFLKHLKKKEPGADAVVRVEREPGEEGQVDFGYVGYMFDAEGKRRKAWCFVMTLSWSRHSYVEFVFDQRLETWLMLHCNAFAFFKGVPRKIATDNLKAAIVKACWEGTDPQAQWAYRECAEHYGFLIGPCRPRTPQHKGKVERGVAYVKENCLGGRGEMKLTEANKMARDWCLTTAGLRIHGTTKQQPLVQFNQTEQAQLLPLPAQPYELATWKQVKVGRDCYVTFENAYYSVPFRLIGELVQVRGSQREVKIFTTDFEVVATHTRAAQPGERSTHPDHLPPYKLPGLLWTAESMQEMATTIGPATRQTVDHLLEEKVVDPLPKIRRLLQLVDTVGATRLEAACQRALDHGDPEYKTIKRILSQRLDEQTTSTLPLTIPPATTFARTPEELVGYVPPGGDLWH